MKKKIFCLVLVLLMLPTMFLFSGCEKSYSLKTLGKDYTNSFKNLSTIKYEEKEIAFDYSQYPIFNEQVINNAKAYKYVNYYNNLLSNMLEFSDAYVGQIASSNYKVSENKKNKVNDSVKEFKKSLSKLDTNTKGCADYVQTTQNPTSPLCLNKLKTLYNSYSQAFESAFNLNSQLMEIFFSNTTLKDYTRTDFEVLSAVVDIKLDARLKQQIVYTTMLFVEKNIDSEAFAKEIIIDASTNFANKQNEYNAYISTVSNLSKVYTEGDIEAVASDSNKFSNFKETTIMFINIQAIINNDIKYYKNACNKINYIKTSSDVNATRNEIVQKQLVDNFEYVTNQCNNRLGELLGILGV